LDFEFSVSFFYLAYFSRIMLINAGTYFAYCKSFGNFWSEIFYGVERWMMSMSFSQQYQSIFDRYDMTRTCAQKADMRQLNLPHGTKTKKWKTEKLKVKNGYAQKYQQTVQGIREVSPEKEKKLQWEEFAQKEGFKLEMKE